MMNRMSRAPGRVARTLLIAAAGLGLDAAPPRLRAGSASVNYSVHVDRQTIGYLERRIGEPFGAGCRRACSSVTIEPQSSAHYESVHPLSAWIQAKTGWRRLRNDDEADARASGQP